MVYLDNNATTKVDNQVIDSMLPYMKEIYGNASSAHTYGLKAKIAVEEARESIAKYLGMKPSEIIFTSGATESNNTVIKSIYLRGMIDGKESQHFIISSIEHKCILESVEFIKKLGARVTVLPVDSRGIVDVKDVQNAIEDDTVLVSIMLANNEIGSINPIKDIAKACRSKGVFLHTDAAQAIGKIKVDAGELGVDFMSSSAHKHYGPKGVGILFIREGLLRHMEPLSHGGGQEKGIRSGTINVPLIVGMAESVKLFCDDVFIDKESSRQRELQDYFLQEIGKTAPDVVLNGPLLNDPSLRLCNNLNISLPNINRSAFNKKTSKIMYSSGSACSSNDLKPSHVLSAIGVTEDSAQHSYRFSLSKDTQKSDIDEAIGIIKSAYEAARL